MPIFKFEGRVNPMLHLSREKNKLYMDEAVEHLIRKELESMIQHIMKDDQYIVVDEDPRTGVRYIHGRVPVSEVREVSIAFSQLM